VLGFRIGLGKYHQRTHAYHALFRTRRERPSSRAADKCDEFASPHRLPLWQRASLYHAESCIVHHGKF
jgi:hypothetical protein